MNEAAKKPGVRRRPRRRRPRPATSPRRQRPRPRKDQDRQDQEGPKKDETEVAAKKPDYKTVADKKKALSDATKTASADSKSATARRQSRQLRRPRRRPPIARRALMASFPPAASLPGPQETACKAREDRGHGPPRRRPRQTDPVRAGHVPPDLYLLPGEARPELAQCLRSCRSSPGLPALPKMYLDLFWQSANCDRTYLIAFGRDLSMAKTSVKKAAKAKSRWRRRRPRPSPRPGRRCKEAGRQARPEAAVPGFLQRGPRQDRSEDREGHCR